MTLVINASDNLKLEFLCISTVAYGPILLLIYHDTNGSFRKLVNSSLQALTLYFRRCIEDVLTFTVFLFLGFRF